MKKFIKYRLLFCFLLLLVIYVSSCSKEYSYEGGAAVPIPDTTHIDTTKPVDPGTIDPGELPPCAQCTASDGMNDFTWSFKTGKSILCGIDTAIINTERTAFTFFGPSTCASDSGMIFTVYLSPAVLNRDTSDLTVAYASFYYYHTGFPHILSNKTNESFRLVITSYVHATKTATGTFSGTGYRQDGKAVVISSGKFKIRLF